MSGWERVPAALHLDTSIPPAARALYPVLLYLAWHTGQSKQRCSLTGKEIADAFGASLPTTRDCIKKLEAAGWVTRSRGSRREATVFTIHDEPSGKESSPRVGKNLSLTPSSTDVSNVPLVGTLATRVEPDSKQQLVGYYVDSVQALGAPAPRRVVGMVAKQVGELADEGIAPGVIARALDLLIDRRLHPSTLQTLVIEAAAGPRRMQPLRYGRGLTTRQILDMEVPE